ncbi:PaaX family transcriptional regulator C-terminal domain-containing protein [Ilumatobacter nonamiensis]|uniref:PaaX family transcriptional regulator C-terminal domain-containing protein n=1 Tax=Ilumatobacter nonamiensis TaxID=467093 RepID=UPI00130DEE14|nr:PaaX family transcriptional regulator C-terminal domain-containing protein [Ilumatobacter nonamiensis]
MSELGIDPLNARSVVLSSLLGSHPPRQSARSLIALAERFGIRPGTVRTALSRMVASGELTTDDASYELAGRLLDRQREQDIGRRVIDASWDGTWWSVIVESDRRSTAERRSFRASMEGARMAELRPDIWLRPANVPAPPRSEGVIVTRGPFECDDVGDLVGRLWPLDSIEQQAGRLERVLHDHLPVIDSPAGDDALATTFTVAAAAVRFLRSEPQLPGALTPVTWTASSIRPLYDEFLVVFQRQLRAFFAGA